MSEMNDSINMPKPGETVKEYYNRQSTHFSSIASRTLEADSYSDEEMTDKQRERKEKKRATLLKKAAMKIAEEAFKTATAQSS
jgi:hypothetical protein